MAISTSKLNTSLSIKTNEGLDKKGKDIIKSQKFSKVKAEATDEALFEVGNALATLLDKEVVEISKQDYSLIQNQ